MKKILFALAFLCSNAYAGLWDGKYGQQQVFDVARSGCYSVGGPCSVSNMINPFIAPYTNWTPMSWAAGDYVQFYNNGNASNNIGLKQYASNGTLKGNISANGYVVAIGTGIVYIGEPNMGGGTGYFISNSEGYSYGSSTSVTVEMVNPSTTQLNSYSATTTPLAAGQTAPAPTPAPTGPTYISATNIGFETGNVTSWTISNTSGAANWSAGAGAAVVTGLSHTPGGGKSWSVAPYGSYMLSLQPGSGSPTFDSATVSLGLTASQNTDIKTLLTQQSQVSGGNPTPTNAAWTKRDVTLQAGVTYKIAWQYLSTDYTPFNDGSVITLVHKTDGSKVPTLNNTVRNYALLGFTNIGTGDYSTDSYGSTGWQIATFTVPADGDYSLGFAVFNLGDTALSPILLLDEQPGTTLLNGQTFNSIEPNPGSGAPTADGGGGGGAVAPTWPATSDTTAAQIAQRNAARSRVAAIPIGNHLYLEQKIGSNANSVTVEQTGFYNKVAGLGGGTYAVIDGDNNMVNIKQGDTTGRNLIEFNILGNTNNVTIWQSRDAVTGLRDGQESGGHYTGVNINGSTNTLSVKQNNAGGATSGHFAYVDVTGNSNNGALKQTGNGEKTFFGVVNGGSNVFDVTQQGVASYFDLSLTGNGHSVTATQKDTGSHKATVNLTNAGGASAVTLVQQGATAQNINITQQCATLSGCSVSVTQGTGP